MLELEKLGWIENKDYKNKEHYGTCYICRYEYKGDVIELYTFPDEEEIWVDVLAGDNSNAIMGTKHFIALGKDLERLKEELDV